MKRSEFKELFGLADESVDSIILNDDLGALKIAFRKAAKAYHPDTGTGDAERFDKLKTAYELMQSTGIANNIEETSKEVDDVFDIKEIQVRSDVTTSIIGKTYKRKKVMNSRRTRVLFKLAAMVDGEAFSDDVVKDLNELNTYNTDMVVQLNRSEFCSKDKHEAMVSVLNSVGKSWKRLEWSGDIRRVLLIVKEPMMELKVTLSIKLID